MRIVHYYGVTVPTELPLLRHAFSLLCGIQQGSLRVDICQSMTQSVTLLTHWVRVSSVRVTVRRGGADKNSVRQGVTEGKLELGYKC